MRSAALNRIHWHLGWALLLVPIASGSDFPEPRNSEQDTQAAPMSAREAAEGMQLPTGFRAEVFAAEPEVQNPIAMAWDPRGRLWVAENYTYAERSQRFDLSLRDRVLILEDTDGDGRHDRRTVFSDDVQMLTGIAVGRGGVWLMCPPRVLFIPDADGDDIPDGPSEVVLDGFEVATDNYHNFANGLKWGPDGWLYGRCGGSCPGLIGTPGTPEADRLPLAGGIWRYHPARKVVEVLNAGTTNPWGHDWNSRGEAFFVNTVNGHLWHLITGSHLDRLHTMDPNPHIYKTIDQHADHYHFDTGKGWAESRDGVANDLGGGHAHSGAMIYLGDNWPSEYRDQLITLNFHGRRANMDLLQRSGSGYVGRHGPDVFLSPDPFFRGIDLDYGPDGGVYVLDWSDTGECHENTGVHRNSGRIFKITHGTPEPNDSDDLRMLDGDALAALHRRPNEWFTRQARLILADRAASGADLDDAASALRAIFDETDDPSIALRALLTLNAIGDADAEFLGRQFDHPDESVRTWAVRLLTDAWPLDSILSVPAATSDRQATEADRWLDDFERLGRTDPSALVRLALASALQRLPVADRPRLARALVSREEDAGDHNLPLLVWYALIPVAEVDPSALVDLAVDCRWPETRQLIARRLAEDIEDRPEAIAALLGRVASSDSSALQDEVLGGVSEALRGWIEATPPSSWAAIQAALGDSEDPAIRERVRELGVVFGDGRALDEVRRIALDHSASLDLRTSALESLIERRPDDLRSICEEVLGESLLNVVAARGLALFDDPAIGMALVRSYGRFRSPDRPAVVAVLASRPAFAAPLLRAIADGEIPRDALSAFQIRQIHSLGDPELSKLADEAWGTLRESPVEKRALIDAWRDRLSSGSTDEADLGRGRSLFDKTCATCHRLYGEGELIGPDLTGSGRHDLDYILENIVDPSAVVDADYRMTVLQMADGRVLNGLVTARTDRTITLVAPTETITVDTRAVEDARVTPQSPMPEGLLETLDDAEIRDLVAYLRHPNQVPRPEGSDPSATDVEGPGAGQP